MINWISHLLATSTSPLEVGVSLIIGLGSQLSLLFGLIGLFLNYTDSRKFLMWGLFAGGLLLSTDQDYDALLSSGQYAVGLLDFFGALSLPLFFGCYVKGFETQGDEHSIRPAATMSIFLAFIIVLCESQLQRFAGRDLHLLFLAATRTWMVLGMGYCIVRLSNTYPVFKGKKQTRGRIFLLIILITLIGAIVALAGILLHLDAAARMGDAVIASAMIALLIAVWKFPAFGIAVPNAPGFSGNANLDGVDTEPLEARLRSLFDVEKVYLDEDYRLSHLADSLGLSPKKASAFLRHRLNKGFTELLNEYRIREACKLLLEEPTRRALSICYAAGFNSPAAFYRAFEKTVQMTPIAYRRLHLRKKPSGSAGQLLPASDAGARPNPRNILL
ncbi:MAG: AraC family transcriptional regulator [Leptospiraceae bacterium]|nr:AraC family transcriptional regulator [Leptospiraceae bacterium]